MKTILEFIMLVLTSLILLVITIIPNTMVRLWCWNWNYVEYFERIFMLAEEVFLYNKYDNLN